MSDPVLILGAAGRFGRHAVEAFAAAGWSVTAQTRPGRTPDLPPGVTHAAFDATDAARLTEAARGQAVIVNALNPPYPAWPREVPRITAAVLAAAQASGATVLLPGNVYTYGRTMPEVLTPETPQRAETRKGRIRIEMEAAYREAGVPTILLRAGDFIDTRAPSGNWFEDHIAPKAGEGRMTYPGPMDRVHAWAFLP
ncbi:MAG: NAD(P)H-binding protein, partial [Pseudomonadota bacterium]